VNSYDSGYNDGYDSGYNDGYRGGWREAREQALLERQMLTAQLDHLVRLWAEHEAKTIHVIALKS
jgi:flagellar biosynthesis/type III secretory pathway protein FliH